MTLTKGEKEQIKSIQDRLDKIDRNLYRIKNMLIGIAIGIGIGAIIFGILSIKDLVGIAK